MSKQLQLVFSIEFGAPIWDVRSNGQLIMITERDEEKQHALFSLFDLNTHTFLWEQVTFDEEWWLSLVYIAKEVAIFQTFNDTQDIEVQSIFAVSLESLEVLWQVDNAKYLRASDTDVTLLDNGEEELHLHVVSGKPLDLDGQLDIENESLVYPSHYEEGSKYFETLKIFLGKQVENAAIGAFEYYQNEEFFIISANFEVETSYSNELFVFNKEGKLQLHETLDQDLKGLASGTFFIVNRELIFVKGKKELLAYSI